MGGVRADVGIFFFDDLIPLGQLLCADTRLKAKKVSLLLPRRSSFDLDDMGIVQSSKFWDLLDLHQQLLPCKSA